MHEEAKKDAKMPMEGPAVAEGPEPTNPVSSDNSQDRLIVSSNENQTGEERQTDPRRKQYDDKSIPIHLLDPEWEDDPYHPDNLNARKYAASKNA